MIKDRVIQKRIKGKVLAMAMTAVMASFFVPLRIEAASVSTPITSSSTSNLLLESTGYHFEGEEVKNCFTVKDENGHDICCGHTITNDGTESSFGIKVISGNHKVTLDNVKINTTKEKTLSDGTVVRGDSAIEVGKNAGLELNLEGTNSLVSRKGYAGIYVPTNASLTINGSGSLNVESKYGGAGIGGSANGDGAHAGKITIKGGTITAKGGAGGAGIGGYKNGGAGDITIEGSSKVTAFGGNGENDNSEGAPGIGNGSYNIVVGTVKINGGSVKALGGTDASGAENSRASGISCDQLSSSQSIVITANDVSPAIVGSFTGLIWEAKSGANDTIVEGDLCTVRGQATMPPLFKIGMGQELFIPAGSSLTIPIDGSSLENEGKITGAGKIINAHKMADVGGSKESTIKEVISLGKEDITLTTPNVVYTGTDLSKKVYTINPTRTVGKDTFPVDETGWKPTFSLDGKPLKEGDPIINAGTYSVEYRNGTLRFEFEFTIDPLNLKDCNVSVSGEEKQYIGRAYTRADFAVGDIAVSCDEGRIKLVEGTDYTFDLPTTNDDNSAVINQTEAGTGTIRITPYRSGNGNFTGSKDVPYTIKPASLLTAKIKLGVDEKGYLYNNTPHQATVEQVTLDTLDRKDGNKVLSPDDYKVEYLRGTEITTDFTSAGTITVRVVGSGNNFTDSATITYNINKIVLKVKSITADGRQYNGKSNVKISGIDVDFDDPDNAKSILKDDLPNIGKDTKGMEGIIVGADGKDGVNVGTYNTVRLEGMTLSGTKGSNYSVDGTYTVGAAGLNLLTAPVVIEQRDAPALSVGGSYTVSSNPEKFIHTVTVTGKTENDVIDRSGSSKVWVWMDTEDQDAENSQKTEAVWTALDPENNPDVLTPIAVFDNIEPGSTHTFYAYATESTNVKGSEVYSDPDRKFDLLERTDKPEAGVLTINPDPNEDGETYTATITPPEGDAGPFEYGFDSGNGIEWQESPTKADCLSGTQYTGYIRYAATKVYLANAEGTQCGEPVSTEMLQAKKPEITTSAGGTTFGGRTNVIITYPTAMPGMEIYYTTDGSTPSKDSKKSTLYKGEEPFSIDKTTTVKAIATRSNMKDSDMAEELFTAEKAIEVADGKVQSLTDNTIPSTLMGVQLDPDSPPISNAESIRTYMNAYLRTMNSGYEFDNVAYYDLEVEMRIYDTNGKQVDSVPAGENDFPRKIDLTYDNLRSADPKFPDLNGETKYDLVAVHMYSGKFDKFKAGEMENITKIDQVEGDHLSFTVNGTSPLAIGWKVATNTNPDDPNNPDNPDDPNNPDNPDDPNNPDNPDDPNNPDDPTNPDDPNNPDNPDPNANGDGTGNQNGDGTNGNGTTSSTNAAEQGASDDSKSALSNLMPKTGDPISFIPWIAAAVVSIGVIVGIVKKKNGKKKKPNKTTKKTTQKSTQKTKKKK